MFDSRKSAVGSQAPKIQLHSVNKQLARSTLGATFWCRKSLTWKWMQPRQFSTSPKSFCWHAPSAPQCGVQTEGVLQVSDKVYVCTGKRRTFSETDSLKRLRPTRLRLEIRTARSSSKNGGRSKDCFFSLLEFWAGKLTILPNDKLLNLR